ncbi:Putative sensor histidine kinase [Aromatoleum petrolei]|nr:Putative sensor histidine kinase [Aromatoleum petrolei]
MFQVGDVTLRARDGTQTFREKLARIILDEMVQFVGLLDPDGRTIEINRAALTGAGLRIEDVVGKAFWDTRWWAVSESVREFARNAVGRARVGELVRGQVEVYGRSGGAETLIVDFSLAPIRAAGGQIVLLLAEGRDISEIKRAEAEIARKNDGLEQLLDKVQRLDSAKSAFFANVSHELRTPLTLILGPAESLLQDARNLTRNQRRDLEVIQRNAVTLLRQVNDLLDIEKFDAGKLALDYASSDLARLVHTVAGNFDALAEQRGITYTLTTPIELPAELDTEKFERIVLNLLSNAFKFTPVGGRIGCTIEMIGSDRVLLSVRDSGPGVRPEIRAAVFERFFGEGNTAFPAFGSTGLGLAIARSIVELHGGTITVLDAPGGGALFQVEMPLCAPAGTPIRKSSDSPRTLGRIKPDAAPREVPMPEDGASAQEGATEDGRPLVLVADDNPDMRGFVADILSHDYRVVSACDGEEALAMATNVVPDLIVTDLMMPKLGGVELLSRMRACQLLAQVPVVVLSARADEPLRLHLLSERVQDYIIKPFPPHELRARVRNLLTMKAARDALQKELATQEEDLSVLTHQLIDNRQALQERSDALRESEQRWRAVYENLAAGIALTDWSGKILAANPALQTILGYSEEELRALAPLAFVAEEERAEATRQIQQLGSGEATSYRTQRRYLRKNGRSIWVNVSVSPLPYGGPAAPALVAIIEDITERKNAEDKVRYLAFFDELTDLPNRVQLDTRLHEAIDTASRQSRPLALLMLALERFKDINYTLGKPIGDRLLQEFGPRCRRMLADNAVLAHFGGRHFGIVIPGAGVQEACNLTAGLLRDLERPFEIGGFTLEIGAHIGIAVFPGHGTEAATLTRHAEVALRQAMRLGQGYALYTRKDDPYHPRRLQLMGELRAAIANDQLVLYCQPKLELASGRIVATEMLVRWQHPAYGLISPDQFVPFVESTGLIGPLTKWVLEATLMQCRAWERAGVRLQAEVNLSTRNLEDPRIVEQIRDALTTWGGGPSWIGLEITESAIMAEPQVALTALRQLKDMGMSLYIDDYGTGYSSLAYLQKLPVDAIKIDKSFVQPMLEDAGAALIVQSTVDLGHKLGLRVIAEGVENQEICERLRAIGCDEAQGYFVAMPMPVGDFLSWTEACGWRLAPRAAGEQT